MKAPEDKDRMPEACGELSPHEIADLRSRCMHAIRFQLVVRLLHAGLREDTLSIFWDHSPQSLVEKRLGEAKWRLVLGRGTRIEMELPDPWVLGYPDDAEARQRVEAALDEMVEKARCLCPEDPRARARQWAAAKAAEAARDGTPQDRTSW